jgi:NAD(P)H-hydrate epimerase
MLDEEYITPEQMSMMEKEAIKRGISVEEMMENAGREVALFIEKKFGSLKGKKILVFCGTGNNGGDGLVAARYMAEKGAKVKAVLLGREEDIKTEEARKNWHRFKGEKIVAYNAELLQNLEVPDAVVDAIFGTGIRGRIREPARSAIEMINRMNCYRVAVDIPSGLDPLTGELYDVAVKADATVSIHKPKLGLKGKNEITGELYVAKIGI